VCAPCRSGLRLSDTLRVRPSRRHRLLQLRSAQPTLFRGFGMMPLAPLDVMIEGALDENLRALLENAQLDDDPASLASGPDARDDEPGRLRSARGRDRVEDFLRRVHEAHATQTLAQHHARREPLGAVVREGAPLPALRVARFVWNEAGA